MVVDRSELFTYNRIKSSFNSETAANRINRLSSIKNILLSSQLKLGFFLSSIGFLLGRAVILDFLSPFGIAYLAVAMIHETSISFVALSVLLGAITLVQKEIVLKYILTTGIIIILHLLTSRFKVNRKLLLSLIAAGANFLAGYFIFYIKNYFAYDMLMIIIESMLIGILIYIYDSAFPAIKNFKNRKVLSTEEIIAFSILIAFCFVGAEFSIAGFSIKNICIILLILAFSYFGNAGTGAAVGIILGIIQALSGGIMPAAIGVYSLCGLLCGVLKGIGRIGCSIGFILGNALMTFYINGSTEVLIRFPEILLAAAIFMLIPKSYVEKLLSFNAVFSYDDVKSKGLSKRYKEYTLDKLNEVSDVFNTLSTTLRESLTAREYFSQTDAAQILDQAVSRSCTNCGMQSNCWKRDFYKSYQYLFGILSTIENEGENGLKLIPAAFKERCLKADQLVSDIKYYHDLFKNSLNWKKKMNENKLVVCDQLREVSTVVSNLALKIDMEVDFNRDIEEQVMVALDCEGIHPEEVIVVKSVGTYEIDIRIDCCGGKRDCIKNIIPIVNKATGKKFVKKENMCRVKSGSLCNMKLKEAQKYQVATGVARGYKSGKISGDNYSFIELKDGKYMLALSDGMGTGAKAALESNTTITLLEKFLYAGFDKDVAVKTINSLLLMKSNEESYATIDMTVINQYNGEVEFVKVGAASTFVKYEDRVDIIRAGSLPVGILNNIDLEFVRRKISDGNFIVMISDGILDANTEVLDKEKWFAEVLQKVQTRNPQKMADEILDMCLELGGGVAGDDMLVLVAKLWETL